MRFWYVIIFFTAQVSAQSLDTIYLNDITIQALRYSLDDVASPIDSTILVQFPSATLSEVLQQQSNIFTKTYGAGSSATTSIRGGSASHTLVLWNGFPISNTMLGQSDFSLLPSALFDEVQLELAGNSATWGSAAIAGSVHLNNQLQTGNRIQLRNSIGSFGLRSHYLKMQFSTRRWTSAIKIWQQQAENDFSYRLNGSNETNRQTHAMSKQWGFMQENQFSPNQNWIFTWNNWYQNTDRAIPPTTTQNRSIATQEDESFRTTLGAKWLLDQTVWQARTGLFWERLDFFDQGINSQSNILNIINEIEGKAYWKYQTLNWGINFTRLQAETSGYENQALQHRLALFTSYDFHRNNWTAKLALRQEWVDNDVVPITPSLQFQYSLNNQLNLTGNITRNFRLPTFNDLYWEVGGNPNLRAELGWSEALAINWQQENWSASVTAFNRNLKDRILWQPLENSFNWSPQNIDRVWSRGVEARLNGQYELDKLKISGRLGYDYVRSTVEDSKDVKLVGKQLIYTPEHQFFSTINIHWQRWQLNYNHKIVGRVLIQARSPKYLDSYQLGFLSIARDWEWNTLSGNALVKVNNLWNEQYRIIDRRPMPLRHYEFSFLIKL